MTPAYDPGPVDAELASARAWPGAKEGWMAVIDGSLAKSAEIARLTRELREVEAQSEYRRKERDEFLSRIRNAEMALKGSREHPEWEDLSCR